MSHSGFYPSSLPLAHDNWRAALENNPTLPKTYEELCCLAARLWPSEVPAAVRHVAEYEGSQMMGDGVYATVECHDFFTGMGNPDLTAAERELLTPAEPSFENQMYSIGGWFELYWNTTRLPRIDTRIVKAVAEALDYTHDTFQNFGYYLPYPGKVLFDRSSGYSYTDSNSVIHFSTSMFKNADSDGLLIRACAYHEDFHRLQLFLGWSFTKATKWFTEGTATWAEVKFARLVNGEMKLNGYFLIANAKEPLTKQSYQSLPFWLFLDARSATTPGQQRAGIHAFLEFAKNEQWRTPTEALISYCEQQLGCSLEKLLIEFGLSLVQGSYHKVGAKHGGKEFFSSIRDADDPTHPILRWPCGPCTSTYELDPTKSRQWALSGTIDPMALRFLRASAPGFSVSAEVITSDTNGYGGFSVIENQVSGGVDGIVVDTFPDPSPPGFKPDDAFALTTVVAGGARNASSFDLRVDLKD